jgi:uracil-DNA glycosylase
MNVAAAATAVERCASVTGVQAMMKKTNDRIIFAPFDTANPGAKVVFVGLTPGVAQLRLTLNEAAIALQEGVSLDTALDRAKQVGAFAGAMRTNLITMLDGIDLPSALDLPDSQALFEDRRDLADSTSAICHAVLVRGRNYSGTPAIAQHRVLTAAARQVLAANLAVAPDALIVPLGRAAASGVMLSGVDHRRVLAGFPHPSGANGHRAAQYNSEQDRMSRTVRAWFGQGTL